MTENIIIWLSLVLAISIIVNCFAFWYIRKVVDKFTFISENLADLVMVVENYKEHLKQVYKMEMFYGDETLEYLMSHTRSLLVILVDYDDIYKISLPTEPSEAGDQEIERSSTQEDEETEEKEIIPVDKENVFYAGTRGGNS